MAELIPIEPVVRSVGGIDYIATMAGHDAGGLLLAIRVQNGHLGVAAVVRMDDEAAVRQCAGKVQAGLGDVRVSAAQHEAELRELTLPGEAKYREALLTQRYKRRNKEEEGGPEPQPWPKPLEEPAWFGLAGDVARAIEPHTEADPAALLLTMLVFLGNAMGHMPHARVAGNRHTANTFVVIVGPTAKGRKGSSIGHPRAFMAAVDPVWEETRYLSGLSTGEGLIANIRDPVVGKDGVVLDAGESDKRLMIVEEEFAAVLRVMTRESNTLSTFLRQAWDSGNMGVMTRQNPLRARGAHISILGHATKQDLAKYLEETDAWNGFANRFLWICARRSTRRLPRGDTLPSFFGLVGEAHDALLFARTRAAPITWSREAGELWDDVYPLLSEERPGRLAAVTGRAEAHVLRLAMLYALLGCSEVIELPHLQAAFEVWRYAEDSAAWLFSDDSLASETERVREALGGGVDEGMNRRELYAALGNDITAAQLTLILEQLMTSGHVRQSTKAAGEKGGRPSHVYHLVETSDHNI